MYNDDMSPEDMMWADYDYQQNTGELDWVDSDDTEEDLDYEEDPD